MNTKKTSKKVTTGIIIAIIAVSLIGGIVFFLIDYTSYYRTVERLKHRRKVFEFFPDYLPEDATGWQKSSMPTILQGSGYTRITIDCTDEYMDSISKQYDGKVQKAFYVERSQNGYASVEAIIVTDKDQMYVSNSYDVNYSYSHPQYKYDYREDDVSNIHYYTLEDDIFDKTGNVDTEEYDVRTINLPDVLINKEKLEGVIVYILYDSDNWNHSHYSLIVVNREKGTVTFLVM